MRQTMRQLLANKYLDHYSKFQHTEDEVQKLYHKDIMESIARVYIRIGGGVLQCNSYRALYKTIQFLVQVEQSVCSRRAENGKY